MIHFHQVDRDSRYEAYQWHRGYASGDSHLFPRGKAEYGALVLDGAVWCATVDNDYCAMAYYSEKPNAWEVGGLMVQQIQREAGVGSTLARLVLGNVLTELDPLKSEERVLAYILAQNDKPRKLIESKLKFRHNKSITIPGTQLPGLLTGDDGNVHGDEFELAVPDSLEALVNWCENWSDKLRDGAPARITLPAGHTFSGWINDLKEMIVENV